MIAVVHPDEGVLFVASTKEKAKEKMGEIQEREIRSLIEGEELSEEDAEIEVYGYYEGMEYFDVDYVE